jgi:TonB family protein
MLLGQTASQQKAKCTPQVVRPAKSNHLQPKSDTSFEGYKRSPIVVFDIDESGATQHAKIKRSSGSAAGHELALNWVRHLKYKPLPGCGILGSEATVIIDFTAQ